MIMPDEWCCGNTLYSVGMIDEARELARRNVEAVKQVGAATLLTSCAEGYRMWKVDYPKMLNIATSDLGFKIIHLVEFADEMVKRGAIKLKKSVDLRLTYHDSCGISRLCDSWAPWKGERGWMGMVNPPLKRRRGTEGLYGQSRNIINSIPGVKFVEMPRIKENAFCCGAGRGTKEAFPELASFSAKHRLEEVREVGAEALVSSCPWCKNNFAKAAKESGDNLKLMDMSELILKSIGV
jgi:Fe-S oxidoreductase